MSIPLSPQRAGPGELLVPALPSGLLAASAGARAAAGSTHDSGLRAAINIDFHSQGQRPAPLKDGAAPEFDVTAVPEGGEVGVEFAAESQGAVLVVAVIKRGIDQHTAGLEGCVAQFWIKL